MKNKTGKWGKKSPRQSYRGDYLLRSPWRHHIMTPLLHYLKLFHQVLGIGHLVDDEQQVAHVHADGALHFVLEGDVAAHGLPVAVEGQTNEVAVGVDHRTAGLPELPPVMSLVVMKLTTRSPASLA